MQRRQGEEREFSAGSMTSSARAALQYLSTPKLPHLHFPLCQDGENGPCSGLGARAVEVSPHQPLWLPGWLTPPPFLTPKSTVMRGWSVGEVSATADFSAF